MYVGYYTRPLYVVASPEVLHTTPVASHEVLHNTPVASPEVLHNIPVASPEVLHETPVPYLAVEDFDVWGEVHVQHEHVLSGDTPKLVKQDSTLRPQSHFHINMIKHRK